MFHGQYSDAYISSLTPFPGAGGTVTIHVGFCLREGAISNHCWQRVILIELGPRVCCSPWSKSEEVSSKPLDARVPTTQHDVRCREVVKINSDGQTANEYDVQSHTSSCPPIAPSSP